MIENTVCFQNAYYAWVPFAGELSNYGFGSGLATRTYTAVRIGVSVSSSMRYGVKVGATKTLGMRFNYNSSGLDSCVFLVPVASFPD